MRRPGSYAASHPEKGKPTVPSVLWKRQIGETMLKLNVETIGDVAIIECEGKIVRGESAIKLRDVVMSQREAHTVVIELSEVRALEGGGLGVLVVLQRWACAHNIRLKLFNPSQPVRARLQLVSPLAEFDIPTLHEMIRLLGRADSYYYYETAA